MKYCLKLRCFMKGRSRVDRSVASARRRTATGGGRRAGLGSPCAGTGGFRSSRCCGIGGCCRGSGCAGGTATLEIGRVPACALELKTRGCQLFAELGRTAGGAFGQGRIGHFLQHILSMAAGVALVGVNGHEEVPGNIFSTLNCKSNPLPAWTWGLKHLGPAVTGVVKPRKHGQSSLLYNPAQACLVAIRSGRAYPRFMELSRS